MNNELTVKVGKMSNNEVMYNANNGWFMYDLIYTFVTQTGIITLISEVILSRTHNILW